MVSRHAVREMCACDVHEHKEMRERREHESGGMEGKEGGGGVGWRGGGGSGVVGGVEVGRGWGRAMKPLGPLEK